MKKYVKPTLSFFELNLSTTISAGCAIYANSDPMACPVQIPGQPGLTIFQEATGCIAYTPDAQDTVCYHVPMADLNVFES